MLRFHSSLLIRLQNHPGNNSTLINTMQETLIDINADIYLFELSEFLGTVLCVQSLFLRYIRTN